MGSELRPHRLFWSPEAVAETALAWPSSRSITIGSAAATLQVAIAGAVMMGGVGEPHPTWASYLADAARAGVVFAILSVLIFLPTLVILLLVHWLDGSRSTLIRSMSVVGLSHLSILPLAVCGAPGVCLRRWRSRPSGSAPGRRASRRGWSRHRGAGRFAVLDRDRGRAAADDGVPGERGGDTAGRAVAAAVPVVLVSAARDRFGIAVRSVARSTTGRRWSELRTA
jgi:hypothetical protein